MKRSVFGLIIPICGALTFLLSDCSGDNGIGEEEVNPIKKDVQILSPGNQDQFVVGEPMIVEIEVNQADLVGDLKLYVDDTLYRDSLEPRSQKIRIDTERSKVGGINVYLYYKDENGNEHRDNRRVTFFSDIIPESIYGQILKTFPHDATSYTQGLEFYKDDFYEGTGRRGGSMLAQISLVSGDRIRQVSLDNDIFGEGITILNDTIYQISYQSGKCFVYDMEFNKLTELFYNGEGWGLCNNGHELLMSNGSSEIVWRNPRTFMITKRIEVFDHETSVSQLNELELINGRLYANIYTENRIVEIDTTTGKVLSYIDFTGLISSQPPGVDYFNGIAENNGRIYVTGKLWPNLYEVRLK